MTIEEIKTKKAEAERQIAEILQKLHNETGCYVGDPCVTWEKMIVSQDVIVSCKIELTVK